MLRTFQKLLGCLIGLLLLSSISFAQQDLKNAIYLSKSQRFDAADKVFQTLIKNEPNNGSNYFYYGENYINEYLADTVTIDFKESYNKAFAQFKKGSEVDTANSLNFVGLGRLALMTGKTSEANKFFQLAINKLGKINYKKLQKVKNPQLVGTVFAKLGQAQIVNEKVDTAKALTYLRYALATNPTDPEIYLITGDVFMLINDASTAIKNYNYAKDKDPKSCEALTKIGAIYVRAENLTVAIPYFEDAIKTDPNFAPAYLELGQLYNLAGQYQKAKPNFAKYLELSGDNLPAKIMYATALYKSKDYDGAIKIIEEILAVDKSASYLYRLAAYCYYDKNTKAKVNPTAHPEEYNKALNYMTEFFKITPSERLIAKDYMYHGKIIISLNENIWRFASDTAKIKMEYNRIAEDYKKENNPKKKDALKHKMDSVDNKINAMLPRIKEDSLRADKGFQYLLTAYTKDSSSTRLLREISYNYYSYKWYSTAAKYYTKLISKNKEYISQDYNFLAKSYFFAKNYEKSAEVYTKIAEFEKDNMKPHVEIAKCYSYMDPDQIEGLAKPKYEIIIEKGAVDTVKYVKELYEAHSYLGSFYLFNKKHQDYDKAKYNFEKMVSIDPKTKNNVIQGYISLAVLYTDKKEYYKARDMYKKVLDIDPNHNIAKKEYDRLLKIK